MCHPNTHIAVKLMNAIVAIKLALCSHEGRFMWHSVVYPCAPLCTLQVDFFQTYILEMKEREDTPLYCVEHLIEGNYIKYNSNSGFVSEVNRLTPQVCDLLPVP